MNIARLMAREIFDSRGLPTVECEIILEDGTYAISSVPSGLSKSKYEAVELRDGGSRLMGLGVTKAIENIETIIAPALIGQEPDLVAMDVIMLELDGTENRQKLGANAILATSIAVLKAQAAMQELEVYEMVAHLCGLETVTVPLPMFNMINGGMHVNKGLKIQEFLVVPVDMTNFRSAMEASIFLFYELKCLLLKAGKSIAVGDEGGFVSDFSNELEALDFLVEAIDKTKKHFQGDFVIGLDVAASHLYDQKKKKYKWHDKYFSSEQMIDLYENLIKKYPIYLIEDGLDQDDIIGWKAMTQQLGEKILVVGDDLFATNAQRIWEGIEHNIATGAIIKPNQIGTITEALQAIKLCKEYGYNVIASHRSGETNDTFLADFAVGASVSHIKAGGCTRGERMAKYNQLLRIEDALMFSMLDA